MQPESVPSLRAQGSRARASGRSRSQIQQRPAIWTQGSEIQGRRRFFPASGKKATCFWAHHGFIHLRQICSSHRQSQDGSASRYTSGQQHPQDGGKSAFTFTFLERPRSSLSPHCESGHRLLPRGIAQTAAPQTRRRRRHQPCHQHALPGPTGLCRLPLPWTCIRRCRRHCATC